MLLLLSIFFLTQQQLIQILTGQEAIIDTFTQSGIILQQNLTDQNLCQIIPQQLVANNIDDHTIKLVSGYQDDEFAQHFEYGSYKGTFAKLLQFVQIENGILVLSDDGIIKYLEYQAYKFAIKAQFSIDIPLIRGKVFMQYFYFQKQVLIIGQGFTYALDLEYDREDLFIQKYKIYDQWEVNHINSITTAGNIMIVAMDSGIKLFEFKDYILNELVLESIQFTDVQDVKVFNKNKNDIYYLYILDKQTGVRQFTFNLKNSEMRYNANIGVIPYIGEILDVYGDILMVVDGKIVYEFKINQFVNSYDLIKQHELETEIIDLKLTDTFAIVIGKNGHQILFHSIPSNFTSFEWMNQLIIPNLKQLDIYLLQLDLQKQKIKDLDIHNLLIGITQHTFFYSFVKLQQSYIQCYSNDMTEQISLQYQQYSTQCSQNYRKQQCLVEREYTIQFVNPKHGGNQRTVYIYLAASIQIGLSFIILVVILRIKFKQFQSTPSLMVDSNNVTQQMKTDIHQNHCELQSDKCIPISRDDQTPISELRDQMNSKLNNNRPITQENGDMSPIVSELR